jgi:hypothetical protein
VKHASFRAAEIRTATIVRFPRKKRKGFFASILGALQYSRHMQARRVLGQYRHLISDADPRSAIEAKASLTD